MIPYILHVTVILTVCILFYKIFLQKETFYRLNRWTLMLCLAVSFTLPLLPAPRQWSWRNNYENSLTGLFAATQPGEPASAQTAATQPVGSAILQRQPAIQSAEPSTVQSAGHIAATTSHTVSAHRRPTSTVRRTSSVSPAAVIQHEDPITQQSAPTAQQPALITQPSAPAAKPSAAITPASLFPPIIQWLLYLYWFGVLIFGANFLLQIAVLLYQSYRRPVIRDGRFRIVETSGNRAPCSFGNSIFINPSLYDWETYNQILIHEKIHVSGRHTFDILLAEVVVVLQWFNPFAWLYRKEVENNLEFLTDQSVLLHREVERSAYQLSLLRVSAPHLPFSITTNYNQSLLKKRIVMMNSQHSSLRTIWKYFFLAPVFILLVCALNKPAVFGQSAASGNKDQTGRRHHSSDPASRASGRQDDTTIRGNDPSRQRATGKHQDERDESQLDVATDVRQAQVAANAWTVNSQAEVNTSVNMAHQVYANDIALSTQTVSLGAIHVDPQISVDAYSIDAGGGDEGYGSSNVSGSAEVHGGFSRAGSQDDETEGSWFVTTEDGKLDFELKGQTEFHSWSNGFTVEKSEINPFPGQGSVEFKLVREAGTITFTGQFDGQQGYGHYKFKPDAAFLSFLQQQGVEDIEDRNMFTFFIVNLKKDYVAMVQRNGFPHINKRELTSMVAMHIDESYIQSWKKMGYNDLTERELITAKAMHIDPAYAQEMKAAGYDHLAMRELSSLKALHIDGQYVRSLHMDNGNSLPPVRDLVAYKSLHIDSSYLADLQKLGYTNLPYRDIVSLHSMHITADFIRSFQAAGFKDIPVPTLRMLKSMNITPEFIKGFRDLGYTDIQPHDLSSLKAMGITPEFVREFQKIGFDNIPIHELRSLKAMGVNADYVTKMKEKGFDSKDLNKYIRLKSAFE